MRSIHAGLAILWSGLAAVASAEALPPEDIPFQCARMCGPMVELTSQCLPRRVLRRSGPDRESSVHVGAPRRSHRRRGATQGEDVDGDLERRSLLVIVAVPNAPRPGRPATITTKTGQPEGKGAASVTRITPEIVSPSTSMRAAPPPSPLAPSPDAPPPVGAIDSAQPAPASTSSSLPSRTSKPSQSSTPESVRTLSTIDSPSSSALAPSQTRSTRVVFGNDGPRQTPQRPADDGGQRGTAVSLGAEEQCVCLNNSFNVSEVAALCSSCITQSGDNMSNLRVIMSTCNFAPMTYADGNESVARNIRVSATRPTVVGNGSDVVSRAPQAASLGAASRTLYLVTAMAMLVWAYCP